MDIAKEQAEFLSFTEFNYAGHVLLPLQNISDLVCHSELEQTSHGISYSYP